MKSTAMDQSNKQSKLDIAPHLDTYSEALPAKERFLIIHKKSRNLSWVGDAAPVGSVSMCFWAMTEKARVLRETILRLQYSGI